MSASVVTKPLAKTLTGVTKDTPHVILLISDAWSAKHVGMYGYPRDTMPNLAKFADKAIVYTNHYANSNFTVPGTASILTGMDPWNHRSFSLGSLVKQEYADRQIFNLLSPSYKTVGFAQNCYADQFLGQFENNINTHIPFGTYNLNNEVVYDEKIFNKDPYVAFSSFEDNLFNRVDGIDSSLFLGTVKKTIDFHQRDLADQAYKEGYLNSYPSSVEFFRLSDMVDGLIAQLDDLKEPSFVYFHFFTPHWPYEPYQKFFDKFAADDFKLLWKPVHPLLKNPRTEKKTIQARLLYDSFLASWDFELERFFKYFNTSGLNQKSFLFMTSDHGEMFERGKTGHREKILYEPVIRVPLIVSTPTSSSRVNINDLTTNTDLLPTIASLTGTQIPTWSDGMVLPGLGGIGQKDRSIFIVDAEHNSSRQALTEFSFSMHKENYKLIKYQYPSYNEMEFYDLAVDPEELSDLYTKKPKKATEMEIEMKSKIEEINSPYKRK